jgi:hypothetical protein
MTQIPQAPAAGHGGRNVVSGSAELRCGKCGYDRTGVTAESGCPECGAPSPRATCIQCGYDLTGLPESGQCPECGTPVEHSLRGMLLRNSSPQYVGKLHRGVFLVVTVILLQLLIGILAMAAAIIAGARGGALPMWVQVLSQIVTLALSVVLLVGWWLFSEPDPRYTGADDGSTARKIVRATVAIYAASTLFSFAATFALTTTAGGTVVLGIAAIASIVGVLAWSVQYFASMLYVRWLAHRIPNEKTRRRAKLLLWLGPVLLTFGLLLIGLGPLIALVLYWNLLDQVRKDLKAIRQQ